MRDDRLLETAPKSIHPQKVILHRAFDESSSPESEDAVKEQKPMSFKQGDVYKCTDAKCAAEITVTKGAAGTCTGNAVPRCCCGKDMVKK